MANEMPLVLVADDEENIRFVVESGLQLAGFDTVAAADGREPWPRWSNTILPSSCST